MGNLFLIDSFESDINKNKFIVFIIYSAQRKCIVKIYKQYSDQYSDFGRNYMFQDVSSFVTPVLKPNGSTALTITL